MTDFNFGTAIGIIISALMLFGSSATYGAEGDVTIHTVSTHVGVKGLNNINPGVAYDLTDRLRLGALLNSYKKPSAYAAYMIPILPRLRVGIGAISGYQLNGMRISGKTASVIPLFAVEVDVLKNISVVWMGQAINLEVKFR